MTSTRVKGSDAAFVSVRVAQRWLDHHGLRARAWLDRVPRIAQGWAQQWNLVLGPPLQGGSVSIVLLAEREEGPAVLKLAAPWSRWSQDEAAALRAWDGDGAARLLAAADDASALLLERIWPGTPATGRTVADVAALLGKLSRPAIPPGMPALVDALGLRFDRALENRHGLLSGEQIRRARCSAVDFAGTPQGSLVLCHGDLLSKNILVSDERGLLAVDPNPCAGYLAYDAALWALTESPVTDTPERAAALATVLDVAVDNVLRWVCLLAAVEVCLAPLTRAEATLHLARSLGAEWFGTEQ